MKRLNQLLCTGGVAVLLGLSAGNAGAQDQPRPDRGDRGGRGNFDPAERRQRRMDFYKEQLEVKSDDEWKIVSDRIEKVTNLQRDILIGGFGGFGGRRGGGGGGGENRAEATSETRRNPFGGEPNPDADALQKALDSKASADELKAKLAKLRESQKDKETKLASAQAELRKVLSVRQEATAVMMGLLK